MEACAAVHLRSDAVKMTVTSGAMCVMAAQRGGGEAVSPSQLQQITASLPDSPSDRPTDFRSGLNEEEEEEEGEGCFSGSKINATSKSA